MAPRTNKRSVILQAAEKLLRARRVHELTMEAVAEAAHVGKGTIYNHFENKDDLLFQLGMQGFDELCEVVRSAPPGETFAARMEMLCERISEFFHKRRAVMRMMQEQEGRLSYTSGPMLERWLQQRQALVDALAQVLEEGAGLGAIRQDVSADVLAMMLMGMMRARGRDYQLTPKKRPPVSLVVELFLQGACRPGQ